MADSPDPLDRAIARLKEPVELAPELTDRVMAEIAHLPLPQAFPEPGATVVPWWRRRLTIQIGPIGALAAAAALAGVFLAGGLTRSGDEAGGAATPVLSASAPEGVRMTQFLLVAPDAREVSVAGDFNDWSVSATPLVRAAGDGVWWVTVPLEPGRYRYAFVVDGTGWRSDPEAPSVVEDEFGRPSSVLTIGGA